MTKTLITTGRTDCHAPSSPDFDPAKYEPMFYVDFHSEDGNSREMTKFTMAMVNQGWKRGYGFSRQVCGHCGHALRYAAVMFREDVREFILVGETCQDNRFELSQAEFRRLREQGKLNAERRTRREIMARLFEENPLLVDLSYLTNIAELNWSDFLGDMYRALNGGWITSKQVEAACRTIRTMSVKFWEREAARIEREANGKPTVHIGSVGGKLTVTGKVTFIFEGVPFAYGGATPFTYIVEGDGFVVKFTTTSRTFDNVERGNVITVTGTVKAHAIYRDTPQTVLTRVKLA